MVKTERGLIFLLSIVTCPGESTSTISIIQEYQLYRNWKNIIHLSFKKIVKETILCVLFYPDATLWVFFLWDANEAAINRVKYWCMQ